MIKTTYFKWITKKPKNIFDKYFKKECFNFKK